MFGHDEGERKENLKKIKNEGATKVKTKKGGKI